MSHHAPLIVPHQDLIEKVVILPDAAARPSPPFTHTPDPQELRAVEAVFSAKDRESATVAGLLGLWTGTMLLNDLARETFTEPAGEVEAEEPKRKDEDQ